MNVVPLRKDAKPRYRVPYRKPADVLVLNMVTRIDLPVERVLRSALDEGLASVAVFGFCEDGEVYLASSLADGGDLLWLMEIVKQRMMEV